MPCGFSVLANTMSFQKKKSFTGQPTDIADDEH